MRYDCDASARPHIVEADAEPTDGELIELVREGDARAYGRLWERHVGAACGAARRITSKLEADDIVSEAFAATLSAIRTGAGPREAFRPYLFQAVRNVAATWGRKPKDLALELVDESTYPSSADASLAVDDRMLVAAALDQLPPRWRTVLWHLEIEGMSPRELAPVLGISANSVSVLGHRARAGLRRAWGELAEAPEPRALSA